MNPETLENIYKTLLMLLPEFLILVAGVAMMTAGPFLQWPRRFWVAIGTGALVVATVALFLIRGIETDPYASVALNDAMSFYARLFLLLTGLLLLAMAHNQVGDARAAEFFGAFLLITAGAMLVATANELIFLFVGLELVSIPTYLLLYLSRRNPSTQEAATKYFFLSVFSAALLLFGLAYLYGLTGVSNLKALSFLMRRGGAVITPDNVSFGLIAVLFIMGGLGFRVAAVPFHFYAPDVYQGSPTIVTAMLAWVPKAIGFLAMIRALTAVVSVGDQQLINKAIVLTWVLAVATMILGNTVALLQNNLKRLLAYSSIAHAGYLLIGVAVAFTRVDDPNRLAAGSGAEGLVFYLVAYAFMTLGAFAVLLALGSDRQEVETIDDVAGLGWSRPALGLALAVCLFSLAGIPPLAGFWGKFFIFASAWTAAPQEGAVPSFQLLTIIGVLNAAIGAYYYIRVVMAMYLRDPQEQGVPVRPSWPSVAAVTVCAGLSVVIGLVPGPVQTASRSMAVAAAEQPEPGPPLGTTEGDGDEEQTASIEVGR